MEEYFRRVWGEIIGRAHGPFAFRLVLQPLTVAFLAARSGWRDARAGRPAYGWAVAASADRPKLLREGWAEIAKVFVVAIVVDVIYEGIVFRRVSLGRNLIVATLLALLPYPLVRGSVNRIATLRFRRGKAAERAANRAAEQQFSQTSRRDS
jgi:hypothetical protein